MITIIHLFYESLMGVARHAAFAALCAFVLFFWHAEDAYVGCITLYSAFGIV